jgi:hypothetical protein
MPMARRKFKRRRRWRYYVQINEPHGDAHRLVVHSTADKGEAKRWVTRMVKNQGVTHGFDSSHYMITRREG